MDSSGWNVIVLIFLSYEMRQRKTICKFNGVAREAIVKVLTRLVLTDLLQNLQRQNGTEARAPRNDNPNQMNKATIW